MVIAKSFDSSEGHATPSDGMECKSCMEDMGMSNYVEYRTATGPWLPSLFCETCIKFMLSSQWEKYVESLGKASCAAERRRLVARGPPATIRDRIGLEVPDGETVADLWYASDKEIHSAALEGALVGDELKKWWEEIQAFKFDDEEEKKAAEDKKTEASTQAADTTALPGS